MRPPRINVAADPTASSRGPETRSAGTVRRHRVYSPAMSFVANTALPALRRSFRVLCLCIALGALTGAEAASAQYRFGIAFGGAGMVGVLAEYRWEHRGLELQAGTWRFRDLSLSLTGKQYVGSYAVAPYAGVGLWGIVAGAEAGTGYGLIARFPVGLEWSFVSRHAVGAAVYLNRALAVKRPDPEDLRPPRGALIPLPELSYRWQPRN